MGISRFHERAPSRLEGERHRHKMREGVQHDPSSFFWCVSWERVEELFMGRT